MTKMTRPNIMNRDSTLELIVERLGNTPNDFSEKINHNESQAGGERRLTAGVLLPLHYKNEGFVINLIKRSKLVSQAGDLGFPGGMLDPFLDRLFMHLMRFRCPPIMTGKALRCARKRGKHSFATTSLFLANALRESWEEVRLNPMNVKFLGPLPTYDLYLFRRSIFPLVGYVKKSQSLRSNEEVEKIIEIPLQSFFEDRHYAACLFINPDGSTHRRGNSYDFPCFIHNDSDGQEEILWGATFQIIMSFLAIVFDYEMPSSYSKRTIEKRINRSYLRGASPQEQS